MNGIKKIFMIILEGGVIAKIKCDFRRDIFPLRIMLSQSINQSINQLEFIYINKYIQPVIVRI